MSDLLIRDLDNWTHKELNRRANRAGMSLQAYVSRLLQHFTATPSLDDWLQDLGELTRHHKISGAEAVRAARDEPA